MITVTRNEEIVLNDRQARKVVEQYLDLHIGDHRLISGVLLRHDDHGHHRGGDEEVRIERVTSYSAKPNEMHVGDYEFLVACIRFRDVLQAWVKSRSGDNGK